VPETPGWQGLAMVAEAGKVDLQKRRVKCPKCGAQLEFRRSTKAIFDSRGFVSCKFTCQQCRTFMTGIIDPFDGALLVSAE
jgi:transposase-like protein